MISSRYSRLWEHRAKISVALVIAVAAFAVVGASTRDVEAGNFKSNDNEEHEIEKLAVCYALGTDTIGRGDLEGGKDRYEECFTSNAVLTVYLPGDPIGTPTFSTVGTDSWADFVEDTFVSLGYVATQHLIGSIYVDNVKGNKASMSSYLNATHVRPDGSINIANGTYVDEVVRQNGRWKISKRTLTLISLVDVGP